VQKKAQAQTAGAGKKKAVKADLAFTALVAVVTKEI
jgi:hypothetical protein